MPYVVHEVDPQSSDWYIFIWPWDPDVLEEFKFVVPQGFRRWDPVNKVWRVHRAYLQDMIDLFDAAGYTFKNPRPKQYSSNTNTSNGTPKAEDAQLAVLFLAPNAPLSVVKAAYRAMSQEVHPDKPNGSNEKMVKVNLAFEEILKLRGVA